MLSKNKGAGGEHKRACLGGKQGGCAKPQLLENAGAGVWLYQHRADRTAALSAPDTDQIPARALLKAISCDLMQSVD